MRHLLLILGLYLLQIATLQAQSCTLTGSLQDGLVGYWPFCGNANDASGNGNDGVVNGVTAVDDRFGNPNAAFSFDGLNDDILVPHNPAFNSYPLTINLWMKSNGDNDGAVLMTKYCCSNWQGWNVSVSAANADTATFTREYLRGGCQGLFQWYCSAEPQQQLTAFDEQWHMYTFIISETGATIFWDGIAVATQAWIGSAGPINNALDISIGSYFSNSYFYTGLLDDIGIWTRSLTNEEVAQVYVSSASLDTYYLDSDGDGFGDPNFSVESSTGAPASYVPDNTDCHDSNANVYPGASCDDSDALTINDEYSFECVCIGVVCPQLEGSLQQGLVGYWPFCGNANDESGNGNDGVVNGATLAEDRFGNANQSYQFNLNDITVPIGNAQFASDFTISTWVRVDSYSELTNNYPTFIWEENAGLVMQAEASNSSTRYNCYFLDQYGIGGSQVEDGHVQAESNISEWNHVVLSNQNGINSLYVNGVLAGVADFASTLQGVQAGSFLKFGNGGEFSSEDFFGSLDDIGIWNRALTAEEIAQLYGNYNPVVSGCTTADACNYNSLASIDDGSCLFAGNTCDDNDATTLNDVIGSDCICNGVLNFVYDSGDNSHITDAGCTNFLLPVSFAASDFSIYSTDQIQSVFLNMEHSFVGDLIITLNCPNGQSAEIYDRALNVNGGGGFYLGTPIDNDIASEVGIGFDYQFYPQNTLPTLADTISSLFTDFTDIYTVPAGNYNITGSWDDLIGCPVDGEWTLEICDQTASDDGNLFSWGIAFNDLAVGCTDPLAFNYNPQATINVGCQYTATIFVYNDLNGNGTHEADEPGLGNWPVLGNDINGLVWTNSNGYVVLPLTPGQYQFNLINTTDNWVSTTPTDVTIDLTTGPATAAFGLQVILEESLVEVWPFIGPWDILHCTDGYESGVYLENIGSQTVSGFMTLSCDPLFTPDADSYFTTPPVETGPGYALWNLEDFMPGEFELLTFHIDGPGVEYLNQSFTFDFDLTLFDPQGNVIYNDNWSASPVVACAYDPNDITGFPEGLSAPHEEGYTIEHYILPDNMVEFRVRFQNTGTLPAEDIDIYIPIDPNQWELSTIQPLMRSAEMQVVCLHDDGSVDYTILEHELPAGVVAEDLLIFSFDDIYLPDSASNPEGSHGYVYFRMRAKHTLNVGDEINAQAFIYFEQNPPITTNETYHVIFDCTSFTPMTGEAELCAGDDLLFSASQPNVDAYAWNIGSLEGSGNIFVIEGIDAGEYTLELNTSNMLCTQGEDQEVTVIVHDIPQLDVPLSATVCEGESITFDAASDGEVSWSNGANTGETIEASASFTVTATAVGAGGCSVSEDWSVTVNALPSVAVDIAGNVLTAQDGTSWQWTVNGAADVTTQSITASVNGNYQVEITNEFGCAATSELFAITDVSYVHTWSALTLYPNPMTTNTRIELPQGTFDVALYDITGACVRMMPQQQGVAIIERESLTSGVYQVRVRSENETKSVRLVIE